MMNSNKVYQVFTSYRDEKRAIKELASIRKGNKALHKKILTYIDDILLDPTYVQGDRQPANGCQGKGSPGRLTKESPGSVQVYSRDLNKGQRIEYHIEGSVVVIETYVGYHKSKASSTTDPLSWLDEAFSIDNLLP